MENTSCFDWAIRNNFAEADFWIINKGSTKDLGKPAVTFQRYLTGIKCPALVEPSYGYYLCCYFHQTGIWQQYAVGTLDYKSLRISDIRSFFKQISRQHRQQYNPLQNLNLNMLTHVGSDVIKVWDA